jgi:hypothetical protein
VAGTGRVFSTRISTPARLWTGIVAPIVLVLVAWLVLSGELSGLRAGFGAIGTGTGPGVEASARLAYDLADVDDQVSNMLLVGDQAGLGETRAAAYTAYQQDLLDANASLERIGSGIAAVPGGPQLFIEIENGLSDYRQDVDEALYIDSQVHGRDPAQPPSSALATYGHADNVMYQSGTGILARANQLVSAEQATIAAASLSDLDLATRLISLGIVLPALVLLVLVFVQRGLRRHFKRRANPALFVATVLTAAFTIGLGVQVHAAHDDYVTQNSAATGPVIELWQVQADAARMRTADAHWLLDLGAGEYGSGQTYGAAASDEEGFKAQEQSIQDLHLEIFPDGDPAGAGVQKAYAAFVADDTTLRTLAGQTSIGELGRPVGFDLGVARTDFENYIAASRGALAGKESAFSAALVSGRTALDAWQWLPAVWAPLIALLVLSGFGPRLREYR